MTTTIEDTSVIFRQFRGESDYAPMTEMTNAMHTTYGIEEVLSVEETANSYEHLDADVDLNRDMLLAEADGQLIGFTRVESTVRADGDRVFWQEMVLRPAWQARLEPALLQFNERRACEIAIEKPMDTPHYLSLWRPDAAKHSVALLMAIGYSAERFYFEMLRDLMCELPNAHLPDGIEVRPFEPIEASFRAVYVATREAFRDHYGYRPWTEDDYRRWRNEPTHDTSLWRIAWDVAANEIAGVAINTIFHADNETYGFARGWVENLGVRRPWRGRGLAKALLMHTFVALRERGMTEATLGVDAQNPTGALQLYESVGFEVYKRNTVYRKRFEIEEPRLMTHDS